jgi:DNA-directed RNA polymerase subunit H (RpoH/RPB5)
MESPKTSLLPLITRILSNVRKLFERRGYLEFDSIESKIGHAFASLNALVYIPEIVNDKISKTSNETLRQIYFLMSREKLSHCILIYDDITAPCQANIQTHQHLRVEGFQYKRMLFDPISHRCVPTHIRLSPEEVKVEIPRIKLDSLPSILDTDAIIRYYDWKVGDVIKIIRNDGIVYRLVKKE